MDIRYEIGKKIKKTETGQSKEQRKGSKRQREMNRKLMTNKAIQRGWIKPTRLEEYNFY